VEGKENDDEHANKYANDDDKTDENDYNQTMITATTMAWETSWLAVVLSNSKEGSNGILGSGSGKISMSLRSACTRFPGRKRIETGRADAALR
jgi:hypothetical protein